MSLSVDKIYKRVALYRRSKSSLKQDLALRGRRRAVDTNLFASEQGDYGDEVARDADHHVHDAANAGERQQGGRVPLEKLRVQVLHPVVAVGLVGRPLEHALLLVASPVGELVPRRRAAVRVKH